MDDKQYSLNCNRALCIATKFIPKESYYLYEQEICNGCTYNNKSEEQLACCYCQDGSLYNIEIDSDIPIDLKPKPKFRASKSNYNYIRNNEVEYEWKCKKERGEKDYD